MGYLSEVSNEKKLTISFRLGGCKGVRFEAAATNVMPQASTEN